MTLAERIVDWLRRHGNFATPSEIVHGLGLSKTTSQRNTVSAMLPRLERRGLVKCVRRGTPADRRMVGQHGERDMPAGDSDEIDLTDPLRDAGPDDYEGPDTLDLGGTSFGHCAPDYGADPTGAGFGDAGDREPAAYRVALLVFLALAVAVGVLLFGATGPR